MLRFIAQRLLAVIPVLLVVALVVFSVLRLTPGDPAAIIAGDNATVDDIARIRTTLELDQPVPIQFGVWLQHLVTGDFGYSFYLHKPVTELIAQRLEPTLSLAIGTILIASLLAIPIGALAAWKMGGWFDRALMSFSVTGFSVPVFVIAYLLIGLFALKLGWLPVQGYASLSHGWQKWSAGLILPWMSLGFVYVALLARVTRAAVSEALTEDYIRTARAKGIAELSILLRHALPNAAVPIVTVIGIGFALLVGGVVVTETVFAIPGLGSLTVDAVLGRDFPVVQGVVLFFSLAYVAVNLLVDLSYFFFDPRIRF